MPAFAATTIDALGRRRTRVWDAADATTLRTRLRAESLWAVRIAPAPPDKRLASLTLRPRDLIALLHQLELQVRAGVRADGAIAQLAADLPAGPARKMLTQIHREVAQAPRFTCVPVRKVFARTRGGDPAGESSALPEALRSLAAHLA